MVFNCGGPWVRWKGRELNCGGVEGGVRFRKGGGMGGVAWKRVVH